jgi:predicted RNA-binding Zn ribbon-like protein
MFGASDIPGLRMSQSHGCSLIYADESRASADSVLR